MGLFVLAIFSIILGSATANPPVLSPDSSVLELNTTDDPLAYDYVVQLAFSVDETKVAQYLVNVIYDTPSNRSITTDDILTLYRLKNIDSDSALEVLETLNIATERLFSLDGFDKFLTELSIDFKEYYNRVIIEALNVSGNPLRDVLSSLDVDINNFSIGMAYGNPDPYEEFKKGNFSPEAVTLALEKAGKTMDDLFVATRDEFLEKAATLKPEKITESLLRYNFDRTAASALWSVLDLTMEDVYQAEGFKQLLDDLQARLNSEPAFGVVTGPDNITVNKVVYDQWNGDEEVAKLDAASIANKFILHVEQKLDTELERIFTLKTSVVEGEDNLTYIGMGRSLGDLHNCKYLTLSGDDYVVYDIAEVVNHVAHMHVPSGNISEFTVGSPLFCDGVLVGLGRELREDDGEIILDSFTTAASSMVLSSVAFMVSLLAVKFTL